MSGFTVVHKPSEYSHRNSREKEKVERQTLQTNKYTTTISAGCSKKCRAAISHNVERLGGH